MSAIAFKTRKSMLLAEIRRAGPVALSIFRQAFKSPADLEFAAMVALRTPSGARYSDKAVDEGIHRQFGTGLEYNRKKLLAIAKKAGITVGNKAYKSGLGPPSDPAAWVTCADDIRRVAKAKNLTMTGALKHEGRILEPTKADESPRLAPDIVADFEKQYTAKDPKLAEQVRRSPKARRELRERIVATHARKRK